MKKILFVTGTRADYGKLKSLMNILIKSNLFDVRIFVTGMHMLSRYGSTHLELIKDGFEKIHPFINQKSNCPMDTVLANTINGLSNYVHENSPDMIVVHGDRVEALAGALVGALNNIRVLHIEGGEVSGTIDESIRHSITKLAHIHCVANQEASNRITQLGEQSDSVFIIGSPDIDIMLSNKIPSKEEAMRRYNIPWNKWNILMYHPVTTEVDKLKDNISQVVTAMIESGQNFLVIYPNNDTGTNIILNEYLTRLKDHSRFELYPSIKFEYFLSILKHSKLLIGNSSAGIREASIYGVPAINLGNRQFGRYPISNDNGIITAEETVDDINMALKLSDHITGIRPTDFGDGKSADRFLSILKSEEVWNIPIQKRFICL